MVDARWFGWHTGMSGRHMEYACYFARAEVHFGECKMVGTLAASGTLARFLGKIAGFPVCLQSAKWHCGKATRGVDQRTGSMLEGQSAGFVEQMRK
jgi:hypothetical protein